MEDGSKFDGKDLLSLIRSGKSPFRGDWHVNLLVREIEEHLQAEVIDISQVTKGCNNYVSPGIDAYDPLCCERLTWRRRKGIHCKLSSEMDIVARIARGDVNSPRYDGLKIETQIPVVKFEAAVYQLLRCESDIRISNLLYHRLPVKQMIHTYLVLAIIASKSLHALPHRRRGSVRLATVASLPASV